MCYGEKGQKRVTTSGLIHRSVSNRMVLTTAYLPESCDCCSAYVIADVTHRHVQQLQGGREEGKGEEQL